MRQTYRLVKLRVETVQGLKRLMAQMGRGSLDDLVVTLIRLGDAHCLRLKETGWDTCSEGGVR